MLKPRKRPSRPGAAARAARRACAVALVALAACATPRVVYDRPLDGTSNDTSTLHLYWRHDIPANLFVGCTVEVSPDPTFEDAAVRTEKTRNDSAIVTLAPGVYYWRVGCEALGGRVFWTEDTVTTAGGESAIFRQFVIEDAASRAGDGARVTPPVAPVPAAPASAAPTPATAAEQALASPVATPGAPGAASALVPIAAHAPSAAPAATPASLAAAVPAPSPAHAAALPSPTAPGSPPTAASTPSALPPLVPLATAAPSPVARATSAEPPALAALPSPTPTEPSSSTAPPTRPFARAQVAAAPSAAEPDRPRDTPRRRLALLPASPRPVPLPAGRPICVIEVTWDTAQAKAAEAELESRLFERGYTVKELPAQGGRGGDAGGDCTTLRVEAHLVPFDVDKFAKTQQGQLIPVDEDRLAPGVRVVFAKQSDAQGALLWMQRLYVYPDVPDGDVFFSFLKARAPARP